MDGSVLKTESKAIFRTALESSGCVRFDRDGGHCSTSLKQSDAGRDLNAPRGSVGRPDDPAGRPDGLVADGWASSSTRVVRTVKKIATK